jgi:hypothetical protein
VRGERCGAGADGFLTMKRSERIAEGFSPGAGDAESALPVRRSSGNKGRRRKRGGGGRRSFPEDYNQPKFAMRFLPENLPPDP